MRLPSERFDVIVIGAGPAGVTAAVALGKAGFSVLVCEAGVYPGAENWSGAVYFTENLESPEAFGREVVESAPYERRLVERGAFLYNGHTLLGGSLRSPDVFRSCYTVLRPVYDRYLAEVAREHGVVLASETTVQSLIRHRGRVIGVHTERGPAYADVVFLAEGDASHLVTQEGYEREDRPAGAPHFLQGVKEVVSLPEGAIEERFGVAPGDGLAMEFLLRNATRKGRTARLNMGGFVYTNRDSISLGFVLPLDNLKQHFQGDHNLLMEWLKGLPEFERLLDGGTMTSYGAKIIRGGGFYEIPRLVDDGLAIGGAASGIGIDFPYPNFTGPATAMGLYFARAVKKIAAERGTRGGKLDASPFTRQALTATYLAEVKSSHYYRNVEFLKDWPAYVEHTKVFFERQLDVANGAAWVLSRPQLGVGRRWWELVRTIRRTAPAAKLGELARDGGRLASIMQVGSLVGGAITPGNVARVLWNTVGALVPGRHARIGASEPDGATAGAGVAEATTPEGARLRGVFRVLGGKEDSGRMPLLYRWLWLRFGAALGGAFVEVYTNDDTPVPDKLRAAARRMGGAFSIWDGALKLFGILAFAVTAGVQVLVEWIQVGVLRWDLARFRKQLVNRQLEENRERLRLDDGRVRVRVPYDTKLATITYHEGHQSHIKVMWPRDLGARAAIYDSPLWSVCPAKVYEVRRNRSGHPGVVVNFENCIKCETCWRATGDVHWSRATQQRLVYQVYSPTQGELQRYLLGRAEPHPRLGQAQPPSEWMGQQATQVAERVDQAAAVALANGMAQLQRTRSSLLEFSDELARSPLALEEGRRTYLATILDRAEETFARARKSWESGPVAVLRSHCDDLESLWDDAAQRFAEMRRHAAEHHYFWAEVIARQLADHHFALIEAATNILTEGAEISSVELPEEADEWRRAEGWRAREARPAAYAEARAEIVAGIAAHFDGQTLRGIDRGTPIDAVQREWLRQQVALAGREAGYGRRDVLLEELAAADPSLAVLASTHLLAVDLAAAAGAVDDHLLQATRWVATVSGGQRSAMRLDDGSWRLQVDADYVLTALAERFLVVVDGRGFFVDSNAAGVELEDVGAVGLLGAAVRRLRMRDVEVKAAASIDLQGALDEESLEMPAAGEPCAPVLGAVVPDLLATVRGAAAYLLHRCRDHAGSRVQFPGAMEDEAGRETIAKFGAVKHMLARMEAWRFVLESVSMRNAAAGIDEWTGLAAAKVLASEAFGPAYGSLSYDAGQLFGGTAFSEDDDIAKYYRDSAPFRFINGHDDAYRAVIGRRRRQQAATGSGLVPISAAEREVLGSNDLLADPVSAFLSGCQQLDAWAAGHAAAEDLADHLAGIAVVKALALKACLLRAARRLDAGIPSLALVEACRLLADDFAAEVPALVEEAELGAGTLTAGDDLLESGDYFPSPRMEKVESYAKLISHPRPHGSGEWLIGGFDPDHRRYVPEILCNDERLYGYWQSLEEEFRKRYVDQRFDGLIFGRYLEKLHLIPDNDLHYMVDRGFMRMPIAKELGGEGALKAEYYVLCMLIGRLGDAAMSLAIMGNTSIGTTPAIIGLYQDLPRARAELERVRQHPEVLGEIAAGIDRVLGMLSRPDLDAITKAYGDVAALVRKRVDKSMVLKYISAGFTRAFYGAGGAGKQRDLEGFEKKLRQARGLLDGILGGVDERLAEYPLRQRAHELFLRLISAGYVSAFALTEPTAGSDSGGVKTSARLERRSVHRDEDGVLYFWLDEEAQEGRRNLLDAARMEFDFDAKRLLYRWSDDAPASEIDHSEYDYEKDSAERMRSYMHGGRKVHFADIAELRGSPDAPQYEFWVLNGAKMWITNGRFAKAFALYARTEPEGVTGFMVDRHAEGLVVGADEEKLGQRGSPTNELSLNGVRVPREMIIGFRGRGQVNALETLNTGRAGLAVTTHAALQEMLEETLPLLRGQTSRKFAYRQRDGAPRPLERYWMGRLAEELVGTAAATYELIGLFDNEQTSSVRMESAVGKYYGSEAEHDVIDWMERVRGLEGQTWLHRVEKTRRDARVLNIYEGTNEVQRFLLLKDLVQRVLPEWQKGAVAATRTEGLAYPDMVADLEAAKADLRKHVEAAVQRWGQLVWANVGAQPVFFRLAEIAGLTKIIDATLYRLEWCARNAAPTAYRRRLELASRQFVRRALARIRTLERRYVRGVEYMLQGRYSPETQLGVLSLEPDGAPAETWGKLPERLAVVAAAEPLGRDVEILVLVKPVPAAAPRPRVADGGFAEPLLALSPADAGALDHAVRLKGRDPERVRVIAATVSGAVGSGILREALARGADDAVLVEVADAGDAHDARYVAEIAAALVQRQDSDVVLCGAAASDTGQGILASYLASRLRRQGHHAVDRVDWEGETLRVSSEAWKGDSLTVAMPCVLGISQSAEARAMFRLPRYLAAAEAEIIVIDAGELAGEIGALPVRHLPRQVAAAGPIRRAATPEEAAAVLVALAGDAGSGADGAAPYADRLLDLGEQPQDEAPACLFLLQPSADGTVGAADAHALDVARALAQSLDLPLDVIAPVDGDESEAAALAGAVVSATEPRRVYVVAASGIDRFTTAGHLEWMEELWAMYRGQPQWLLSGSWASELLAAFLAAGIPGVDPARSWAWMNADGMANGGKSLRVTTGVYGGGAVAEASLPLDDGLKVVTVTRAAAVSNASPTFGVPGESAAEVYIWRPRIEYDPKKDPLAVLLSRLQDTGETLESAEFIIDVGYGAGGRAGLDDLAEPLRRLLADEMRLPKVMIGATRKVTQDLELLPHDRQIGQTGATVNPKVMIALAVSGAPQHVDYIGERATILSFNIDADAPLMMLNVQRPHPEVHPIQGDVWKTVPAFIEAIRKALQDG